ncbi:hypothetical protein AAG906_020755 [Vitis piasezkii]
MHLIILDHQEFIIVIGTYLEFFWFFPEARSFLETCVSTTSRENHLHRRAISRRREAFSIVVFYISTPVHRISLEEWQLIKATHRPALIITALSVSECAAPADQKTITAHSFWIIHHSFFGEELSPTERVLDFSLKRRSSYTEGEFWTFWALIFSPEKKETERGGSILREEKFTSRSEGTTSRILEGSFGRKRKKQIGEGRLREEKFSSRLEGTASRIQLEEITAIDHDHQFRVEEIDTATVSGRSKISVGITPIAFEREFINAASPDQAPDHALVRRQLKHEEEGSTGLVVREGRRWPKSELDAFGNFLVMSTKGFELEIMACIKKMEARKGTKA